MEEEARPIARALGISVPRLQLGARGAEVAGAKQAHGVALGDETFLAPSQLAAGAAARREVLAHELVHHAQAQLPASADRGRDAAETEADAIAKQYVATGQLAQPKLAIDLTQPAANTDARNPGVTAAMYLHIHAARFRELARAHIASIVPRLPDGLAWHDYQRFAALYAQALAAHTHCFDVGKAGELRALVHPHDLYRAIDTGRIMLGVDEAGAAAHPGDVRYGAVGLRDWSDGAGRGFVHALETSLRMSVARMGARYLAAARGKRRSGGDASDAWSPVAAGELVLSHPMDALVASALPAHGVLEIAATAGPHEAAPRRPLRRLDPATFEWQSVRDLKLWNWVKAPVPDATAEEVAAALWSRGDDSGSMHAYALTAMPPYFGLPKSWARRLPGSCAHALVGAASHDEDDHDNAAAFAASKLSQEVALQQAGAGDGKLTPIAALGVLQQSLSQLVHVTPILAAWRAGGADPLDPSRRFVMERYRYIEANPTGTATWGNVIALQQELLYAAATQLDQLHMQIAPGPGFDPTAPHLAPYRDVVSAYGRAVASSHVPAAGRALLAEAREQQRMLVARVATEAVRGAEVNVQGMRGSGVVDAEGRALTAQVGGLATQASQIQSDLLGGKAPDAEQLDELLISSEEVSLKAKLRGLCARLALVEKAALQVNDGFASKTANLFDTDIWTLPGRAGALHAKLRTVRAHFEETVANARIVSLGEPREAAMVRQGRRVALQAAQRELQAIQQDTNVVEFLNEANDEIKDAQTRGIILQVAVLIGVSLASAGLGNAATGFARGFLAARGAQAAVATVGLSRTAMLATRVGGLAVESAINSTAQAAILKKPVGATFLEDFLTNLATSGLLHGLRSVERAADSADEAIRALWSKSLGRVVFAKTVQLTGETLVGAATSYVIHRAMHTGKLEPATVTSWFQQGAAIAIGRFVQGAAAKQLRRLETLATVKGWKAGQSLTAEAHALRTAAATLEADPSHDAALDVLRRRGELLDRERHVLDELAANPAHAQQLGSALDVLRADNTTARAEHAGPSTRHLLLATSGLRSTVGDRICTGTEQQAHDVVAFAQKAGIPARVAWKDDRTVTLELGGAPVTVIYPHGSGATTASADPTVTSKHVAKLASAEPASSEAPSPVPDNAAPATAAPTAAARADRAEVAPVAGMSRPRVFAHDPEGSNDRPSPPVQRLWVRPNDLVVTDKKTSKEWFVSISAPLPDGRSHLIVHGSITLDQQGRPVDDLSFIIDNRITLNNAAVKITVGDESTNTSTSLTDIALDQALTRYKAAFGHPPDKLAGSLIDDNRRAFQAEYLLAIENGVPVKEAESQAILATPFGRSRRARGYTRFDINTSGVEKVQYLRPGAAPEERPVTRIAPQNIDVVARKENP